VGSHSFFLQLQGADPAVVHSLYHADLASAPVTDAERALLRLVETVTLHAHRTTDDDVQAVRDAGFTDPQIAEAVYITALFAFFNRVADAFGLKDPGYFTRFGGESPETPVAPESAAG
jgi:alkylhydroperoxidase family enzyme